MRARERGLILFAGLLDYPSAGTTGLAEELGLTFVPPGSRGSGPLDAFRAFLARSSLAEVEEAYTRAFDFEAPTSLDIGCHLFGDAPRRGPFLLGLKEMYVREGFETGPELPDHLAVLLRFLAARPGLEERRELLGDCIGPALAAIQAGLESRRHPYALLVAALIAYLEDEGGRGRGQGGP